MFAKQVYLDVGQAPKTHMQLVSSSNHRSVALESRPIRGHAQASLEFAPGCWKAEATKRTRESVAQDNPSKPGNAVPLPAVLQSGVLRESNASPLLQAIHFATKQQGAWPMIHLDSIQHPQEIQDEQEP